MRSTTTHRSPRRVARVLASVVTGLVLAGSTLAGVGAAQNVDEQTPTAQTEAGGGTVEQAITLASPGVVFVYTEVQVDIRLQYQDAERVSGFSVVDGTYTFGFGSGSGFTVTPDGVVVTASHVVDVADQDVIVAATNMLFTEIFEWTGTESLNPYEPWSTGEAWIDELLADCYAGVACTVDVTPFVTVYTPVDIAGIESPKGLPARVLISTGFEDTDVAVLKVDGVNLPTIGLAPSVGDVAPGDEILALGFPGSNHALPTGFTEPTKIFGRVSNIRSIGSSRNIEVDADLEPGMSGGPVIDGDGLVLGLTSYGLLQGSGESGSSYLRTVDDIHVALAAAGVEASRGLVDETFAEAAALFYGSRYTDAIPLLQKVLALYDGHLLAKRLLAEAQAKAGTEEDIVTAPDAVEAPEDGQIVPAEPVAATSPADEDGGLPVLPIALGVAGLLGAGVGAGLYLRRRGRPTAPAAPAPVPPSRPTAGGLSGALLEVEDGEDAGRTIAVNGHPVSIGREDGCDLVLADDRVSRRHATVAQEDGHLILRDAGSSNGTWVDGERVDGAVELHGGERIRIGRTVLVARVPMTRNGRSTIVGDVSALVEAARAEGPQTDEAQGAVAVLEHAGCTCGHELPADARFCPGCGRPAA